MENLKVKDVLKVLGVSALVVSAVAFPGLPLALIKTHQEFKTANKRKLSVILKRLNKQQMISIEQVKDQIQIKITEKGKLRLLEYDFEKIQIRNKKRDGKWRLIIFDIPEKRKNSRDVFRRKLLQLGLIRVQDSVFASAYPCKDEVDFLSNFLLISEFVTIVVLERFESGEELIFSNEIVSSSRYSD